MTFFTQAVEHGTIDKRLKLSPEEYANTVIATIQDSNAFERHKLDPRHATSSPKLVPFFNDDASEFEKKVDKRIEEPQKIQYHQDTKTMGVRCQCGAEFAFNPKKDTVEVVDPSLKMKEINPYRRNTDEDGQRQYGRSGQDGNDMNYDSGPKKTNLTYNNNSAYNSRQGMQYKN